MPAKKKDEGSEPIEPIEATQKPVAGPSKEELIARIAELEAAKAGGAEPDAPSVECECYSTIESKVGDTVTRWGFDFVVQEGGRHMVGKIPAYAVEGGTGAGRWKPVGMSSSDADVAYWRMQYRGVVGNPHKAEMTVAQMEAAINEKLGDGKRLDHIKA